MKKIAMLVAAFSFVGCTHVQTTSYQPSNIIGEAGRFPASEVCRENPSFPHLFTVVENTDKRITVEIGDFSKVLNLDEDNYDFEVNLMPIHEVREGHEDWGKPIFKKRGTLRSQSKIVIPVDGTGAYVFKISQNDKTFWTQKVFSIAAKDNTLSDEEKQQLAVTYAPIVSYHDQELYYPVSLEYLTNQVEPDQELNNETFILTNRTISESAGGMFSGLFGGSDSNKPGTLNIEFPFKDILNIMPYYGHSESVLKSKGDSSETQLVNRYGKNHSTIYYSIFENNLRNEILINYHFFYSYDPKNGTANKKALPAHIYDRESFTVLLRKSSREPIEIYYGAHLATQTMAQLNASGQELQRWDGGRTRAYWNEKINPKMAVTKFETHPIPFVALGSHGIYPKKGTYAVMMNKIKALVEPAGGNKFLIPEGVTGFKQGNQSTYKLKGLRLENTVSGCGPNSLLAYSGSTVDVLGPTNATFPPFTDREENFMGYADPNVWPFDTSKE